MPGITLEKRIADRTGDPRLAKIATEEAMKDITFLHTIADKAVTLLGTYPVKPGAQEIYDAADLARKQYDPKAKPATA